MSKPSIKVPTADVFDKYTELRDKYRDSLFELSEGETRKMAELISFMIVEAAGSHMYGMSKEKGADKVPTFDEILDSDLLVPTLKDFVLFSLSDKAKPKVYVN